MGDASMSRRNFLCLIHKESQGKSRVIDHQWSCGRNKLFDFCLFLPALSVLDVSSWIKPRDAGPCGIFKEPTLRSAVAGWMSGIRRTGRHLWEKATVWGCCGVGQMSLLFSPFPLTSAPCPLCAPGIRNEPWLSHIPSSSRGTASDRFLRRLVS